MDFQDVEDASFFNLAQARKRQDNLQGNIKHLM